MLGNEQRPHAVAKLPSLEEIVAERIAGQAARIAEELIREAFAATEFDPDEVYGFMNSEEAAEFLGLPYSSFREIAPNLPRHAITPARYGYLRRELLEGGKER
jgi:hypothetical protein